MYSNDICGSTFGLVVELDGRLLKEYFDVLGGLLALSISLGSMAHGPLLGMFTLGVLFPRANKKVEISQ